MTDAPTVPAANESAVPSRRDVLRFGGALTLGAALGGLPSFTAQADVLRPAAVSLVPAAEATTLWYPAPAVEAKIIEQGLPIGNGRLGALVGGDPASDFLYVTDVTMWTGGLNDVLQNDGQFPYETKQFGTFNLLAKVASPSRATPWRRSATTAASST